MLIYRCTIQVKSNQLFILKTGFVGVISKRLRISGNHSWRGVKCGRRTGCHISITNIIVLVLLYGEKSGNETGFYEFKKMSNLQADASLLQQSSGQKPFNIKDIHEKPINNTANKFNFDHIDPDSRSAHKIKDTTPKISTSTEKDSMDESYKSQPHSKYDVCAATFLDVAVLRCLFISHWQEDGVYWCLHYLYSR